jgi:hypothetical protein
MTTLSASDCKPAARHWIRSNYCEAVPHLYEDFEDQIRRTGCVMHGALCDDPSPLSVDLLVTGMPCQAWSRLRSMSDTTKPSDHPGWKVSFQLFFEFLRTHRVRGGIAEQVLGFGDVDQRSDVEALEGWSSPMQLFLHKLREAGFTVSVFRLNMTAWLRSPPRDRYYIVYLSAELGGRSGMDYIEASMQDSALLACLPICVHICTYVCSKLRSPRPSCVTHAPLRCVRHSYCG